MLIAAQKHAVWVVAENSSIEQHWPILGLGEIFGVDCMLPVSSVQSAGWVVGREVAVLELLSVGFGIEIPNPRVRIDDACCSYTDQWVDVNTAFTISVI
jgi:hypothetical protein